MVQCKNSNLVIKIDDRRTYVELTLSIDTYFAFIVYMLAT